MSENNAAKVDVEDASQGQMGQTYLASGKMLSMRLWENEEPGDDKPHERREYETVGFVLKGRAELDLEGEKTELSEGDSWVVPQGASHTYKILETFSAIEATSPPAQAYARDKP